MSERKLVRMKADHRELRNGHRYVITNVRAEALERDGFCDVLEDFEEPKPPKVERAVKPQATKAVKAPAKRRTRKKKG